MKTRIFAITVSVNYTDKLRILLDQNSACFYRWIIVVDPHDNATIDLIKEKNISNVEMLCYPHFKKNSVFDKDGGLRFAQLHVKNLICSDTYDLILLIDSDILLPTNFPDIIAKTEIQENSLYTAESRHDYRNKEDFLTRRNKISFDVMCWGGWGYFSDVYK